MPRQTCKILVGTRYSNYTSPHKQPPKSGYGFLEAVVNGVVSRAGELIALLDAPHQSGGNPGYPARAMLSATIMRYAMGEPLANAFLNRLGADDRLLEICGLPCAPSERAFSQFKNKKLAPHVDMLQDIIVDVFLACGVEIERLRAMGLVPADKPPLGNSLVMDSTDIESWAVPGRTSRKTGEEIPSRDPDAVWGHRTAKVSRSYKPSPSKRRSVKKNESGQQDNKGEMYFGYKSNFIVDANHGLPLFGVTRPANASDMTVMVEDLDACLELYRTLEPRYFLGDKGYDRLENIKQVIQLGMIPIIDVRLPEKDKETGKRLYDGIYTEDGRPTCVGEQPMEYVSTYPEKGHLFQCPAGGCHLKGKVLATGFCNDQHYEKPEGRLLRIVGLLPRCSEAWHTEYKKRPVIERHFSTVKQSRLMDQHRYIGVERVSLHVMLSTLTYLSTALAHLQADDYARMRHMRIKLPRVRREKANPRPEWSCHDPACECCTQQRKAA